jgi:hypothetical protein
MRIGSFSPSRESALRSVQYAHRPCGQRLLWNGPRRWRAIASGRERIRAFPSSIQAGGNPLARDARPCRRSAHGVRRDPAPDCRRPAWPLPVLAASSVGSLAPALSVPERKGFDHIIIGDRQAAHAVRLRRGIGGYLGARRRRQISRPDRPGRFQSRMTRSGVACAIRNSAASPRSTTKPSASKL